MAASVPPGSVPPGAVPGARPISLAAAAPTPFADEIVNALESAVWFGEHIDASLDLAVELGRTAPRPGGGRTADLWSGLATAARADVAGARVIEPHLDALAILDEARADGIAVADALEALHADDDSSWGVFAAEGRGMRLEATPATDGGWRLTGTKPWCSLGGNLSHALVTAWMSPTERGLFAVALHREGVHPHRAPWVSRGLTHIVSAPVDFDAVPARAIGDPGWYLERPGFAWGGIGVAACWWGAALPLYDALIGAAATERADQFAAIALGDADSRLWAARTALADAAYRIDAAPDDRASAAVLAERTRAIVAGAVEHVLHLCDHALGPAPLTTDEQFARRAADLRIYVRQHHGERDLARLGRALVDADRERSR